MAEYGSIGNNGEFTFAHSLKNDLVTEGNESLIIKLFSPHNLDHSKMAMPIVKETKLINHKPPS